MGCPVRKVCNVGGGSAMMTELAKTAALVRGMVNAVKIPVTAKMRLGWDDENITAPDLARVLEDAGVAAIFVHGRTREQGFGGTVNLAGIRAVVQAVKSIPVIGNGDVTTPQAAKKMFDETGCAGVSIGRGAFYNPWIFQHTLHYLQTFSVTRPMNRQVLDCGSPLPLLVQQQTPAERQRTGALQDATAQNREDFGSEGGLLPEPTFADRVRVMCRHLDLMVEVFGEEQGCRMFRKIAPWHAKRFRPVPRIQQTRRAGFHPGGIPRGSGKLHPLASAIPRRERRIAAALPPAAAGRILHARFRVNAMRTHSRAERAGGGVVDILDATSAGQTILPSANPKS